MRTFSTTRILTTLIMAIAMVIPAAAVPQKAKGTGTKKTTTVAKTASPKAAATKATQKAATKKVTEELFPAPAEPAVKWESLFSDGPDLDFAQIMKDNSKNDSYVKNYFPYWQALAWMQQGKTEEALNQMEKVSSEKIESYRYNEASYQLLFYKKYKTFDFKSDDGFKFDSRLVSAADFPTEYQYKPANIKDGEPQNFNISKLNSLYKSILLFPLTGHLTHFYKYNCFEDNDSTRLDKKYEASLYEFYKRKKAGKTRMTNSFEKPSSSPKFVIEQALAEHRIIPYIVNDTIGKDATYKYTREQILQIANKCDTIKNYQLGEAIYWHTRALLMGEMESFVPIMKLSVKYHGLENPENFKDVDKIKGELDDFVTAMTMINNAPEFAIVHNFSAQLLASGKQSQLALTNQQNAQKQQQLKQEREQKQKQQQLLAQQQAAREEAARAEQEKQLKKQKRKQFWTNVGLAALGVAAIAADTYVGVKSIQAGNSYSSNGSYSTQQQAAALDRASRSGKISAADSKIISSMTPDDLMRTTMHQVQQQNMQEYQQFCALTGQNISYDQYMQLKAQAWADSRNSGSSSSYSSSSSSSSSSSTAKKNIESYSSRYGDKDCNACRGTGVCQTCNGSGLQYIGATGKHTECPNCYMENMKRTGKCSTCCGKGTRFGLK